MDYISMSPFHCYKDLLNCLQTCTNIPGKQLDICSIPTFHTLKIDTKNLLIYLTNQKGRKSSHSQFLTMNSYPHKKQ